MESISITLPLHVSRVTTKVTTNKPTMASPPAAPDVFEDEDWVYPRHHKKQAYIIECMSLKHGRIDDPYPRDTIFTKEQLLELRPSDIRAYCNWKAFGNPYPDEKDMPIYGRAGSIDKAKQAVSYFMPNTGVAWMEGIGGNPTRHSSVSNVIKRI